MTRPELQVVEPGSLLADGVEILRPEPRIVVVRVRDHLTPDTVTHLLDLCLEVARAGRYAVVVTTYRSMSLVQPRVAAMFADWIDTHRALMEAHCAAIGMVVGSPFCRGAMRAIFAVAPVPCPVWAFREEADAVQWVGDMLDAPADLLAPRAVAIGGEIPPEGA